MNDKINTLYEESIDVPMDDGADRDDLETAAYVNKGHDLSVDNKTIEILSQGYSKDDLSQPISDNLGLVVDVTGMLNFERNTLINGGRLPIQDEKNIHNSLMLAITNGHKPPETQSWNFLVNSSWIIEKVMSDNHFSDTEKQIVSNFNNTFRFPVGNNQTVPFGKVSEIISNNYRDAESRYSTALDFMVATMKVNNPEIIHMFASFLAVRSDVLERFSNEYHGKELAEAKNRVREALNDKIFVMFNTSDFHRDRIMTWLDQAKLAPLDHMYRSATAEDGIAAFYRFRSLRIVSHFDGTTHDPKDKPYERTVHDLIHELFHAIGIQTLFSERSGLVVGGKCIRFNEGFTEFLAQVTDNFPNIKKLPDGSYKVDSPYYKEVWAIMSLLLANDDIFKAPGQAYFGDKCSKADLTQAISIFNTKMTKESNNKTTIFRS